MKSNTFQPKTAIPVQIVIIILGLLLASFGTHIYSNNEEKTLPLAVLIFSVFIILSGLMMIERIKIDDDIIEKSKFLGLIKKRRNLRNLKLIKGSQKKINTHPTFAFAWLFIRPFFNNAKYANQRYLTLKFTGEGNLVIDGYGLKREDFNKIHKLFKKNLSKNRRRKK